MTRANEALPFRGPCNVFDIRAVAVGQTKILQQVLHMAVRTFDVKTRFHILGRSSQVFQSLTRTLQHLSLFETMAHTRNYQRNARLERKGVAGRKPAMNPKDHECNGRFFREQS